MSDEMSITFEAKDWDAWAAYVWDSINVNNESPYPREQILEWIKDVANAWVRGEGDLGRMDELKLNLIKYHQRCVDYNMRFIDVLKALKSVYLGIYYEGWLSRNGILVWRNGR